jgi:hypothetical protein
MPKEALSGDLSQKLRQNRALEGCRRRSMHRTKTKKFSGSALIPRSNSITRTWIPLHCDSLEILHACFISLFHCANPGIYLSCRLYNPPQRLPRWTADLYRPSRSYHSIIYQSSCTQQKILRRAATLNTVQITIARFTAQNRTRPIALPPAMTPRTLMAMQNACRERKPPRLSLAAG